MPWQRGHWRHDQRRKNFASGTGTTQLAQELSVEGIEHYLDFSTGHRVLYSTAPTTIVYELILDDAVYGTLDADECLRIGALWLHHFHLLLGLY
jgi:hypothetical protein